MAGCPYLLRCFSSLILFSELLIISFLFIWTSITNAQTIEKQVTLTPSNTIDSGAIILSHLGEVSIGLPFDRWKVNITSQNTWQFILILDNSWGFSSTEKSAIEITVNSPSVAGIDNFDDIVFGFTTDNAKYISTWIPMDNNGQKNRIYPECDTSPHPTQTHGVGNIATLPNTGISLQTILYVFLLPMVKMECVKCFIFCSVFCFIFLFLSSLSIL